MDKYEQTKQILLAKAPAEEREELGMVLTTAMDAMRGIEQIGADIDRIATALEKLASD